MSDFGRFQLRLGPGWLQGQNGGLRGLDPTSFLVTDSSAIGDEKSNQLDIARQAVLADIPRPTDVQAAVTAGQAPPPYTAMLDLIGADRVLPRATTESPGAGDVVYAERLRTCWDRADGHSFRGSHGGLLFALARAGFPTGLAVGAVIIQRTKRYSYLDATTGAVTFGQHNGWTFDPHGPATFNQFGIMFGADVIGLADGTQAALQLNAIVREWKPSKAKYMGAKIVVSGAVWGWPFGITWGMAGLTWGGVTRFITPT